MFKNIKAIVLTQTGLPVMSPERSSILRGLLVLLNTHLEENIQKKRRDGSRFCFKEAVTGDPGIMKGWEQTSL